VQNYTKHQFVISQWFSSTFVLGNTCLLLEAEHAVVSLVNPQRLAHRGELEGGTLSQGRANIILNELQLVWK